MKYLLIVCLVVTQPMSAMASGGLFSRLRSSNHCVSKVCAPVVKQVVVEQIVEPYYPPAQPIIVQNNYPPASTVYGYNLQQPLAYNPFTVDPALITAEAKELTLASQALQSEALEMYKTVSSDALRLAAVNDQLRARAELIRATKVDSPSGLTAQANTATNQVICLVPDGKGSYKIQVQSNAGAPPQLPENPAPANPSTNQGISVLQAKCAECHTGSTSKGGISFFDDAGNYLAMSNDLKTKVLTTTKFGIMPPAPAETLTDTEVAALQLLLGE